MRVFTLIGRPGFLFLSLLFAVNLCNADGKTFEVVGMGECADCREKNLESSRAFSGLHVTIDCKLKNGEVKRVGDGELDEGGKFKILLSQDVLQDNKSLKEECYAQLHSAAAIPCPALNGLEAAKIVFKSQANGKYMFTTTKILQFSSALCTSKLFWPYFKYPPLSKTHSWKKNWPKISFPPLYKPKPIPSPPPIYKPKPKPPVAKPQPPPNPAYKPKPKPPAAKPQPPPNPAYKPKSKPPVVKPQPPPNPAYKLKPKPPPAKPLPPSPPTYKPKPPVHKPKTPSHEPPKKSSPPPAPIYKPKPKPPAAKPTPPPTPVYKPPMVAKPLPPPLPLYPIPPFYKKPCPPFSKIPPKYFHHPKFGYFPPLSPFFPQP